MVQFLSFISLSLYYPVFISTKTLPLFQVFPQQPGVFASTKEYSTNLSCIATPRPTLYSPGIRPVHSAHAQYSPVMIEL